MEVKLGRAEAVDGFCRRSEVDHFGMSVDVDGDGIEFLTRGEVSDEVGGESVKWRRGDWIGHQRNVGWMGGRFGSLTYSAALNKVTDEDAHAGPPEVALNEFQRLRATGMARGGCVVTKAKDIATKVIICRNLDTTTIRD